MYQNKQAKWKEQKMEQSIKDKYKLSEEEHNKIYKEIKREKV